MEYWSIVFKPITPSLHYPNTPGIEIRRKSPEGKAKGSNRYHHKEEMTWLQKKEPKRS
jgi:hypothetical protein